MTASPKREDVLGEIEGAFACGDFERVTALAQGLIDANAADAEALALQAWAAARAGQATGDDLRAALATLDRSVALNRSDDRAWYFRGIVKQKLGNAMDAFRDFARAIQLNPKNLLAEREVRLLAMRVRKGSGEHKLIAPVLEKLEKLVDPGHEKPS